MASRHSLKQKLGVLGVDLSSRKATENFCLIGTPLQPLEKAKDEFVPLWKQEVKDEKGRRRLHGAFTGGFSAGHFNTVGSKEGWAPSAFVSSRSERAKQKEAKPEDYMDEEDLEELRDSRKLINMNEQMDLTADAGSTPVGDSTDNDPIAATLKSAFQPLGNDSAGARILKKMGWRFGQGIGPRVSLKQRKQQDEEAFDSYTGLRHVGKSLEVAEDDEEASKHTYPRRDIPVLHVAKKDNRHGLGYKSGITLNDSLGRKVAEGSQQGPQLSAGFGLGALNDADEDDIDVYDLGTASRNRVAFDRLDHEGEETMVIGGRTEKVTKVKPGEGAAQFFPDGTPVVPGFTVSDESVKDDMWFSGPEVPKGWKPDPRRVWDSSPNKENLQKPLETTKIGRSGRPELSATERANLLGEAPLATAPRSVFDFMSAKDKERIQRITATLPSSTAPAFGAGPEAPIAPRPPLALPTTDPQTAEAALRGFQPFTADPAKQARYTAYLHSQATPSASPPLKPLPGQSADSEAFHKELGDYAKAAQLFKPMSVAMAGRFTSAAVVESGPKIHEGLYQPSGQSLSQNEQQSKTREEEREREEKERNANPKVHAAMMGMYGRMTREVVRWEPAGLLCKRFGVKQPERSKLDEEVDEEGVGPSAGGSGPSGKTAKSAFEPTEFEKEAAASFGAGPSTSSSGGGGGASDLPRRLENIGLGEDETQGADILTYERPPMDIFKAIFASDDEDSEEEVEVEAKDDEKGKKEPADGEGSKPDPIQDTGPVDLATFKPTFIPRDGKAKAKDKDRDRDGVKEKKNRKEKKKAAKLSFEVEENGDGEPNFGNPSLSKSKEKDRDRDRPKKKRKDKENKGEDNDAGMFVDRSSAVAPSAPVPSSTATPEPQKMNTVAEKRPSVPKGRKRAIDFLDG